MILLKSSLGACWRKIKEMKVGAVAAEVTFEELVEMANESGIKLEITHGVPTWEAFPGMRHQNVLRPHLHQRRTNIRERLRLFPSV